MPKFVEPLIYVLVLVAVVVLFQTLSGIFFKSKDQKENVNRRLTMLNSGMSPDSVYASLVRKSADLNLSDIRLRGLYTRLALYCQQAGLTFTPKRLFAIGAGVAGAIWLFGLTVMEVSGNGLLLSGFMSLLGACLLSVLGVGMWLSGKRNKRRKQFEEQLPLALDIVNRGIRAGHPVVSAVQLAAREMGDPIGTEFGLIVDETTYGSEFKDALSSFARRTGSRDAHFFAVSVGIQSETGGNLAEILEGLANVMRGRNTLGKRVKALASEGRASAYLLSALPVGIVGFVLVTNPTLYTSKFSDPVFWPAVTGVLVVYAAGWLMINRIINFKY